MTTATKAKTNSTKSKILAQFKDDLREAFRIMAAAAAEERSLNADDLLAVAQLLKVDKQQAQAEYRRYRRFHAIKEVAGTEADREAAEQAAEEFTFAAHKTAEELLPQIRELQKRVDEANAAASRATERVNAMIGACEQLYGEMPYIVRNRIDSLRTEFSQNQEQQLRDIRIEIDFLKNVLFTQNGESQRDYLQRISSFNDLRNTYCEFNHDTKKWVETEWFKTQRQSMIARHDELHLMLEQVERDIEQARDSIATEIQELTELL